MKVETNDSKIIVPSGRVPNIIDDDFFKIVKIRFRVISPIIADTPFYDATMGPFKNFESGVVEIFDREGFSGECDFPVDMYRLLKTTFAPILLETPKVRYSELFEKLYWKIRNDGFRGHSALALGHLDRAFYDLAAKRKELPLYKFLGGKKNYVQAYASGGGTNLVGTELLDQCLRWETEGYSTIKMKFGGLTTSVEEDMKRISLVREALRPETKLAVDANQSMSLQKALNLVKELESLDIAWLEEPIHSAALDEIEVLCSSTKIPISYGESERSAKVFPTIVRAGVKHLQPIVGHVVSFREWVSISNLAIQHNLQFSGGGFSHYNSQFVASVKDAQLEFLEPVIAVLSGIFLEGPKIENGRFNFYDTPGLGIRVDWKRLSKENRIAQTEIWT